MSLETIVDDVIRDIIHAIDEVGAIIALRLTSKRYNAIITGLIKSITAGVKYRVDRFVVSNNINCDIKFTPPICVQLSHIISVIQRRCYATLRVYRLSDESSDIIRLAHTACPICNGFKVGFSHWIDKRYYRLTVSGVNEHDKTIATLTIEYIELCESCNIKSDTENVYYVSYTAYGKQLECIPILSYIVHDVKMLQNEA
ncbi:hypothetical protein D5b_00406 [Faustovirus]|nr:hypothetical protein D5b_00406 [Faustovirus]AMN84509.1 hypothetical protein D6_00099 [Faustovirus]AMP44349.1 hypothetical protein PRJ_Dakar_00397 [Faustovirus]